MKRRLTLLSFGGGQDSTAILLRIIHDDTFRRRYAPDILVVVMSDTGDEHPHTREHVSNIQRMCLRIGIPFKLLHAGDRYHSPAWPDLITPQIRDEGGQFKPTMVQLGTKSCTDKLKIAPIYKYLDEWINEVMNYGFEVDKRTGSGCLKQAIKKFHNDNGQIDVLIGYAKGEERRAEKANKLQEKADDWSRAIRRVYPLIESGMDRDACQSYIESILGYEVMPSNCMLCPYQSEAEIEWLRREYPGKLHQWVKIEKAKIIRHQGADKNYGVFCNKELLPQKIARIKEKFKDVSDEWLRQYKKNHGCQTNSM